MKRKRTIKVVRKRAVDPSEHSIQESLVDILKYAARPEVFVYAIPNAGRRSRRAGAAMVAEGLRKGVADLCIMWEGGQSGYLEMKTRTGPLRVEQKGFRAICGRLDHRWAMARSVEEALDVLRGWNALKEGM